jgi:hypothetical protein
VSTPNSLLNVLGGIVIVALVTTIVAHKGTASDIGAAGNVFVGSLRAAEGH